MKPLRVAVVTDGIYPYFKGGKEVRFHQLLRRLAGAEVEIDVFTMHWWDGPPDRQEDGVSLHAICRKWCMYSGERRSLVQAVMFALACTRLLTVEADVIDADHMPYLQLLPLKVISRLRGIPLIVTWHEWWGETYWRSYLGRAGHLAARLERFVASLADCLIVPTEQTAESMTAAGVERDTIAVLPSGIDSDAIALVGPARRCYDILFVGRLLNHKGADMLLGALKELRDRNNREVSCAIVGEGPEKPQLDQLVHRLGLSTDVDRLATASRVGVVLNEVPYVSRATLEDALFGGEDYELIVGISPGVDVVGAFVRAGLRPPILIGNFTADVTERILDGTPFRPRGYEHQLGGDR